MKQLKLNFKSKTDSYKGRAPRPPSLNKLIKGAKEKSDYWKLQDLMSFKKWIEAGETDFDDPDHRRALGLPF